MHVTQKIHQKPVCFLVLVCLPQLTNHPHKTTTMVVYGSSEAFQLLILLLLVSDSIGRDNLQRASLLSGVYGALVAGVVGAVSERL